MTTTETQSRRCADKGRKREERTMAMRGNVTAQEAIAWFATHNFCWYQPPMDVHPSRVWVRGKVRRWKRDADRFSVPVEKPGLLKFRIDNGHLDRLRMVTELRTLHGQGEFQDG